MKVSIVAVAHNQREGVVDCFESWRQTAVDGWQVELLVIDNYSTDGTREWLRRQDADNLQVIYQPQPREGLTWRRWQEIAAGHVRGDYVLLERRLTDGVQQGSAPEQSTVELLDRVQPNTAAIYGTWRKNPTGSGRNDFLSKIVNLLFGSDLRKVLTASKVIRADLFRALNLRGNRSEFEVGLTVKLLRAGVNIEQVDIVGSSEERHISRGEYLKALGALVGASVDTSIWRVAVARPELTRNSSAMGKQ